MLNFDSSIGGLVIVLFMFSLITGFAVCVTLLISRVWGDESPKAPSMSRSADAPPLRRAA